MTSLSVPPDFPRSMEVGSVSGFQPKIALRKIGDVLTSEFTAEELAVRYENCADLVQQLQGYCTRKMSEHPEWTRPQLLEKLRRALPTKGWDLTALEIDWIIGQLERTI